MNQIMSSLSNRFYGIILMFLLPFAVGGCQGSLHRQADVDKLPLVVLKHGNDWKPGLAVIYISKFVRHTSELPKGEDLLLEGQLGPPILEFNHSFDRGEVFASGQAQGIGMEANGFVNLAQTGTYRFKALSNDGIRVWIADRLVVNDPEFHKKGDQYSATRSITASDAGWANIRLRYFQRKGTATLKLYWQPPGSKAFSVIPATVFAHSPPPR